MHQLTSWRCTGCDTWNVVGRDLTCHCCGSPALTPVQQATAAAAAAARQSDQYALVAAVQAAQIVQQQPQQQHVCQHHHPQPRPEFDARKWLVIGGVGTVGALAFAVASIAIAISACCATACLLVVRSMWRHYLKGL